MLTLVMKSFKTTIFQWSFPISLIFLNIFYRPQTLSDVERLSDHSPFFCIFKSLTGWLCPGCGMTRSLISFFTGNFSLSFDFNPFGFLVALSLLSFWTLSFLPNKYISTVYIALRKPQMTIISLIVLLSWGFIRNL
ncbi:MAG: DUF2752 domain-containing protein [Bdellovibrionales bacterium]|nr:DUF2752 domain-containing protein [Bdellovibrionales bacterium]